MVLRLFMLRSDVFYIYKVSSLITHLTESL